MRCSTCNSENPEDKRFCLECGAPFGARCSKCGAENPPGAKFCGDCGESQGAVATNAGEKTSVSTPHPPVIAPGDEGNGERKTVTALFADIKGSMELMEDLDPEEARAIVDPALKLMVDAAHRYGGYIVQSTGDGIFALFGAPVAHEDHPQRALYAALRMQEDIKHYAERLRADKGVNLQVRVGANTGEVVVRSIKTDEEHTEYTPIGHSTSLASRLQNLAAPGSVAVSEAVRKLVEGYFTLNPLGPARIKGVSEPVNVYEVTGLGPLRTRLQQAAGRGLTRFVGREREMESLKHAAELAKRGRGQIVAAVGEAGVGKSRLFHEFKEVSASGSMVLESFSVSHGKATAYFPVIDLLRTYFKISSEDNERTRREKVNGKILTLDRRLEDTLDYVFALLGLVKGDDPLAQMDAQIRKVRTLDTIKRILLRESLNQPLTVIFEDLHWVDGESQGLLNLLADSIGTARILMLVNYRPEYSHSWGSKTYYTQLRLDTFGNEHAHQMLAALLGDGIDLIPLKRLVIEKTEGNPFFMEEMVQGLLEDGALVRNGTIKLTKSIGQLKIPQTVQAILAARIDKLPAAEKDLLQTLAVIGKEFPFRLIRHVVEAGTRVPADPHEDHLSAMLARLQLAEFIYEQPAVGDVEYTFKHALTREVAYRTVLIERRKLLHERAGRAIEALYADSLEDHVAALGDHFREAGNPSAAAKYLRRAGIFAATRSAFPEAIRHLSGGLELVKALPEGVERARMELDLLEALSGCLNATLGAGSAALGETLMRMHDLCVQLSDDARLFFVEANRLYFHGARAELAKARELGERAIAIAERLQRPSLLVQAYGVHGYILWQLGEFDASRRQIERAIAVPRPERAHLGLGPLRDRMLAQAYLAWNLWALGFPDQALTAIENSLAFVRNESSATSLVFALIYSAQFYRFLRDPQKCAAQSREARKIANHAGSALLEAQATYEHGWSQIFEGEAQAGLREMNCAVEALEATGAVASAWRAGPLAEAWAKSGNAARGLELLHTALGAVNQTAERCYEAELRRLVGELTLSVDSARVTEARGAFDEAIDVARSQNAKSLELRATVSLARLLAENGSRDEARVILSSIYGWFTEGFDTADLMEARSLLDVLSA